MKAIDRYILEKFQITKDSKLLYKYYPKDKRNVKIPDGSLYEYIYNSHI